MSAYEAGLQQAEREAEVRERGALIDVRSAARLLLVAMTVGDAAEISARAARLKAAIYSADDATMRSFEAARAWADAVAARP